MTVTAPVAAPATKIPFRFHPRVFAALGADLVTSDVVAVMELVKNSYDAGASEVNVRFGKNPSGLDYLEVEDNGSGMTREIIENVWCLVATPHKTENRIVGRGTSARRVSGEKGLGRLSAARLGDELRMLTRSRNGPCWDVTVLWPSLSEAVDLSESAVHLSPYEGEFPRSGTRIRIHGLKQNWSESQVAALRSNLSRLVPPFSKVRGFSIFFTPPHAGDDEMLRVMPEEFLTKPKYGITGSVTPDGDIAGLYRFTPFSEDGNPREQAVSISWAQLVNDAQRSDSGTIPRESPRCGPFRFDLRAWDIGMEGRSEIAHRFELKKSSIRAAIEAHQGVSVYRDGILALPKSVEAKDWLGLDLRRVSKVGTRLATNQIVGLVEISSSDNPGLRDTSDRERLASGPELSDFRRLLVGIVRLMETERDLDRTDVGKERRMVSLFKELSAIPLVEKVQGLARKGYKAEAAVSVVERYARRSEQAVGRIERRFAYYSRLATIGTIAELLVHEIRNRTTAIGGFVSTMKKRLALARNVRVQTQCDRADRAVDALESLADRFAPLASRAYKRGGRTAVVEERIRECLALEDRVIKRHGVLCTVPQSTTVVAVDPGELDTVLLNLITNATFWLSGVKGRPRAITFAVRPSRGAGRVDVEIADNGPGIAHDDFDKVFLPGVTKRPGGIGMGLTVASEVVAAYDGRMLTTDRGSGAVFIFDLPVAKDG